MWAVALALQGCSAPIAPVVEAPAVASGPNLLLITLDTTRADHLGLYGYARPTSPVLDALGARALVFTRAESPIALTRPAHLALLTGRPPLELSVLNNGRAGGWTLPPIDAVSLPEVLAHEGYATAAFVSAGPLAKGSGAERGFAVFDDHGGERRDARGTTDVALAWLSEAKGPWLAWVHYYDPHTERSFDPALSAAFAPDPSVDAWLDARGIPVVPPRGPLEVQAYDAAIATMDAEIGRLLEALDRGDLADHTAIVVVGDHGEGLGQHGIAEHPGLWAEQLSVPMIAYLPGRAPERIEHPASIVDLLPTVHRLAGLPGSFETGARDALAEPGPLLAVLQHPSQGKRYALTDGDWRFVRLGDTSQLFDTRTDPHQLHDVAEAHPEVLARLQAEADRQIAAQYAAKAALAHPESRPMEPEQVQQLQALGYLDEE